MNEFEIMLADFGLTEMKPDTPLISPRGRNTLLNNSFTLQSAQKRTNSTGQVAGFGNLASKVGEGLAGNVKKELISGMLKSDS